VYVTYPPEHRRKNLLQPRAWIGYFVGHDSETVHLIYDPESKRVKRVDQIRVSARTEGLDDSYDEPSFHRSDVKEDEDLTSSASSQEPEEDQGPQVIDSSSDDSSDEPVTSRFFGNTVRATVRQGRQIAAMALAGKKRKIPKSDKEDDLQSHEDSDEEPTQEKKKIGRLTVADAAIVNFLLPYQCNENLLKIWNTISPNRTLILKSLKGLFQKFLARSQEFKDRYYPGYDSPTERTNANAKLEAALKTLNFTKDQLAVKQALTLEENIALDILRTEFDFLVKAIRDLLIQLFPDRPSRSAITSIHTRWT
jgi:hypothetical protein